MNPLARLISTGAIRSGEFTDPVNHRRLPLPTGFRYFHRLMVAEIPASARQEVQAILKRNPRTVWLIARRA